MYYEGWFFFSPFCGGLCFYSKINFPFLLFLSLQLLGQLENTGPPPADKEKISSLPTVTVTQEQVGKFVSCGCSVGLAD